MNRCYSDILERINIAPLWFDEHGVPRYEPFAPKLVDIYADEAALVLIECQGCGREFKVAFAEGQCSRVRVTASGPGLYPSLAQQIATRDIHPRSRPLPSAARWLSRSTRTTGPPSDYRVRLFCGSGWGVEEVVEDHRRADGALVLVAKALAALGFGGAK